MRRVLLALILIALAAPASAKLDDPAARERARELFQVVRCMVCQNEPIATSNAELAADMRRLIRERIAQGRSNAEIKAYLTERYGDYVLLNPPVKPATYVLWYGPAVLLVLGGLGVVVYFRRRRARPAARAGLSAAEERRVRELLDDTTGDDGGDRP